MTIAMEEAPAKPKQATRSDKPTFLPEDIERAVKLAFPDMSGTMLIRYLWSSGSVHRFRVNWWSSEDIVSKFLHVTESKGEIKVQEK